MPHVSVRQMSIDTEQLCHEMAQRLCALSNKKYWFCTDFNVEIIDVGLETGDVIAVAFMLVEADVVDEDQSVVNIFILVFSFEMFLFHLVFFISNFWISFALLHLRFNSSIVLSIPFGVKKISNSVL